VEQYVINARKLGINNMFFHKRQNFGHDFSGWSDVLFSKINNKLLYEKYDYYIFLNSSCMGPFVPVYVKKKWTEIFTDEINDKVKLVGPTINLQYGLPHVQSYMMCTDKVGLRLAIKAEIFKVEGFANIPKKAIIYKCEVGLSLCVLNGGYDIKCMLKAYDHIDFHDYYKTKVLPSNLNFTIDSDMCSSGHYCGISFHPYEVIFFKSNRGITSDVLDVYAKIHLGGVIDVGKEIIKNNNHIQVYYGLENFRADITNKFLSLFMRSDKIIVPCDFCFNMCFGDIKTGVIKSVFIIVHDKEYVIEECRKEEIVIEIL
jgi:hypothetical protein